MRRIGLLISGLIIWSVALAQQDSVFQKVKRIGPLDSLISIVNLQEEDKKEVDALAEIAILHNSPDSGIIYGERGIALAKSLNYKKGEADCLYSCCFRFALAGNVSQCIFYALRALEVYEKLQDFKGIAETKLILQGNYRDVGDIDNALVYALSGEQLSESHGLISKYNFPGHQLAPLFLAEIGKTYLDRNQIDSSLFYTLKAIEQNELFYGTVWNFPLYLMGRIQIAQGNYTAAMQSFRQALPLAGSNQFPWDSLQIFSGMSKLYLMTGKPDSVIYYSKIVIERRKEGENSYVLDAIDNLAHAYKIKGEKDSAIRYIEFRDFYKDSVSYSKKLKDIQNLAFDLKLKQQESISTEIMYREKLRFYTVAAGLLFLLIIAIFMWRNIRQRKKAYSMLERQKQETDQQKLKTEKALSDLKDTQTQLIQSEKMASLGELTSGIAHEIQNPLNFVNNFSEVNTELIEEMQQQLDRGNVQDAKTIANEIQKNEQKINQHGKRADGIVKGMLQHSRTSSNKKEPADLNGLANEYLRLSFQGYRTRDKSFNVTLQTDFDATIGEIDIIPQDIGRLFLNLYNNAFYAVSEKKKQNLPGYEPVVSVSTKKLDNRVEIRVRDNGNGIPPRNIDKIFQPFFTTKPAGQGTGLGLSLSYDIVKAHGGEIQVESREGQFTEFVIGLPLHDA